MSIIRQTIRCDWPGCKAEVTIGTGIAELSDRDWEGRCFVNWEPRYHACPEHRFKSSEDFEQVLGAEEKPST